MKLVLLVRTDLRMSAGKTSAQVAHAAVLAVLAALADDDGPSLRRWLDEGQPKIVLAAPDAEELHRLAVTAGRAGLPVHIVRDAGRTDLPAGTETVAAIGPAENADLDQVTGTLPLL